MANDRNMETGRTHAIGRQSFIKPDAASWQIAHTLTPAKNRLAPLPNPFSAFPPLKPVTRHPLFHPVQQPPRLTDQRHRVT